MISAERLLSAIAELAAIGGRPDGGVDRVAGGEADRAGRLWVQERMREAGLRAEIDGTGNVIGTPSGAPPWLLLGSHTDTVPAGGRLDGAYGVVAALEVARSLRHPRLAAADFADEEGVVGTGGLTGSTALCSSPRRADFGAYLELHIEQGPRLETAGLDLGVVTGIVGIDHHEVRFTGAANHAGTTPMAMRRDAGAAAGRLLSGLPGLLAGVDPEMVGNIGDVRLEPGAPNVVPGLARLVVELRALDPGSLVRARAALGVIAEGAAAEFGCSVGINSLAAVAPSPMDPGLVAAVEAACAATGRGHRRLVSGAGHDAGVMARHLPAAMLFVPSRGGVSHNPEEQTADEHLVLGAQVLLASALFWLGSMENPSL